jgi:hypothetical protein
MKLIPNFSLECVLEENPIVSGHTLLLLNIP